jgi:hypothetical protein
MDPARSQSAGTQARRADSRSGCDTLSMSGLEGEARRGCDPPAADKSGEMTCVPFAGYLSLSVNPRAPAPPMPS